MPPQGCGSGLSQLKSAHLPVEAERVLVERHVVEVPRHQEVRMAAHLLALEVEVVGDRVRDLSISAVPQVADVDVGVVVRAAGLPVVAGGPRHLERAGGGDPDHLLLAHLPLRHLEAELDLLGLLLAEPLRGEGARQAVLRVQRRLEDMRLALVEQGRLGDAGAVERALAVGGGQ